MSQLTDEQFGNLDSVIADSQPPLPQLVNQHLTADAAYARLLKKLNIKPVLISREVREFRLDEPVYIRRIEVVGRNNNKILQGLSLVVRMLDGTEQELRATTVSRKATDGTSTEVAQYIVKNIVNRVTVRSKLAYRKLTIDRVDVLGYTLSQLELLSKKLEKAIDTYNSIDAYVADKRGSVTAAEEKKDAIETEIDSLVERQEEAEELTGQAEEALGALQIKVSEVSAELDRVSASLKTSRDSLAATENSSAQLKEEISSSNKEIVRRREELQRLVNDRNLISDEYRDYVSEGKGQALTYMLLMAIPILVVAFCSWQLYQGAQRILMMEASGIEQVLSMSLQRLPFAAAIAFVVAVCWKVISVLINRVMVIHQQRLALARLLVIAKDTVASSSAGLDITEEDRFREHMALKLQMLKGHLTSELGKDFEYQATTSEEKVGTAA